MVLVPQPLLIQEYLVVLVVDADFMMVLLVVEILHQCLHRKVILEEQQQHHQHMMKVVVEAVVLVVLAAMQQQRLIQVTAQAVLVVMDLLMFLPMVQQIRPLMLAVAAEEL